MKEESFPKGLRHDLYIDICEIIKNMNENRDNHHKIMNGDYCRASEHLKAGPAENDGAKPITIAGKAINAIVDLKSHVSEFLLKKPRSRQHIYLAFGATVAACCSSPKT